jgi:hypothetical protein
MANEVMSTLFGVTPEALMAQRESQLQQRATQYAQLDPMQAAQASFYTAGSRLGQGIGGLLGAEDPELMRVKQRQSLLQSIDLNDPTALREAASKALQAGDSTAATQLAQRALDVEAKKAGIAKDVAAANRERQQTKPAELQKAETIAAVKQAIRSLESQEATPERDAALQIYKDQLNVLEQTKPAALSELGKLIAERNALDPVKNPEEVKAYNDKIKKLSTGKTMGEELGEGLAAGFGMLGKALGPALKKEGEGTGEFAAKDFSALGSAVASGTASKRNIQIMDTALKNAFTGKFSDTKESVVTAIQGLGLPVGEDLKQAASNTQLINAMGTRYVFPLVKNFPGSLAAKELDRLEKTAPGSLQQPETIRTLMNLLKVDLAENEFVYGKAKEYKNANKGSTINFNQADARIEFQNKLNDLRSRVAAARQKGSMTAAEKSQIDALKKDIGVE